MTIIKISESTGHGSPRVAGFYEPDTGSIQYVAICEATKKVALIDVVQRFHPTSGATGTEPAQEILDWVRSEGLTVEWILDTHPHADHFMRQFDHGHFPVAGPSVAPKVQTLLPGCKRLSRARTGDQ